MGKLQIARSLLPALTGWLFVLGYCGACGVTGISSAADPQSARWVYSSHNLQVAENVPKVKEILRRAAAAGYNGLVLSDFKLNILSRVPDWYFKHAKEVKKTADELGIEIIPCVAPFGYSGGMLIHDSNLAEGLPAKEVPLVADNGFLRLVPELKVPLPGGGFDAATGDKASGWDFQDEPGRLTFVDRAIKYRGTSSLRIEQPADSKEYVNARVSKAIQGKPWRQYHLSAWFKSDNFEATGQIRLMAMSENGRVLAHSDLGVQNTQEWKQTHVVFNSLESGKFRVYVGVWGPKTGKLWVDDVELSEVVFLNVIERPSCPIRIRNEAGVEYQSGRDFEPIRDDQMIQAIEQGNFEVYHEPPVVKLTRNSRIKSGEKLWGSYFHVVSIHDQQLSASLSDPKSLELVRDQVRRVRELFQPKTFFLSHDEIRVANWDRPVGEPCGKVLAENVSACCRIIREEAPGSQICIWSDMFDPFHNAVKAPYYLVNGDLTGSWEGLDREVTIVNWNSEKADSSLEFFQKRGHRQILAGYYDGPVDRIKDFLQSARKAQAKPGIMFTTWQDDYRELEAFAKASWGKKSK